MILLKIFLITTLLLHVSDLLSQVYLQWSKKYEYQPGYGRNIGWAIIKDSSSNIYVTGVSGGTFGGSRLDMVLIKYTENGNLTWLTRFADTITPFPNNSSYSGTIILDDTGNIFIGGTRLWKYDTAGNLKWNVYYGVYNGYGEIYFDNDMNILSSSKFGFALITRKQDYSGELLWETSYNPLGTNHSEWQDAAKDNEDNVLTTGYMNKPGFGSYYDWVTVKYSPSGELLWANRYNTGEDNLCYAMTSDDSNNVIVTGSARFPDVKDMLTIKYSSEGEVLWEKYFDGGFGGDTGFDVEVDASGNVYVAGTSAGLGLVILKYDAGGNLLWTRSRANSIIGNFPMLKLDKDRNVYISFQASLSLRDVAAFEKYDTDGNFKWYIHYNDSSGYSTVRDFFVDEEYSIYATGHFGSSPQLLTMKLVQTPTGINDLGTLTPNGYHLSQNYPNPFNPVTQIDFQLPKVVNVKIKVYDVSGREIQTLLNEFRLAGSYNISFDGSNLSSGVYFYRIEAEDFVQTKRMILLK